MDRGKIEFLSVVLSFFLSSYLSGEAGTNKDQGGGRLLFLWHRPGQNTVIV